MVRKAAKPSESALTFPITWRQQASPTCDTCQLKLPYTSTSLFHNYFTIFIHFPQVGGVTHIVLREYCDGALFGQLTTDAFHVYRFLFTKGIHLCVRIVGGRSRAEPGWWVCFIKGTKNVTRQGRTLRTWGKTWLVKKSSGRGLSAWVFNALFHCCGVCFPAGLAQEAVSAVTPLHFLTIGLSLSVRHDVFFMQSFFGRQLSSVPRGGQRLKTAVLGQSAAEADWAEGGQSEGHSGSSVQQEWNWWVSKNVF